MTAENTAKHFGAALRRIRKQRQLTIESLAAASDLDPSYLARIERGVQNPSLAVLAKLAEGFDIPLHLLLDFDRPNATQLRGSIKRQLSLLDEAQLRAVTLFIDALVR